MFTAVHARRPHRPLGQPVHEGPAHRAVRRPRRRPDVDRRAADAGLRRAARARDRTRSPASSRTTRKATRNAIAGRLRRRRAALGLRAICRCSSSRRTPTSAPTRYGGSVKQPLRFVVEALEAMSKAAGIGVEGRHQDQPGDAVQRHPRRRPGRDLHDAGEGDRPMGLAYLHVLQSAPMPNYLRDAASAVQGTVRGRRRVHEGIRQRDARVRRRRLHRLRQAVHVESGSAGALRRRARRSSIRIRTRSMAAEKPATSRTRRSRLQVALERR